jgi:hypothetical protein
MRIPRGSNFEIYPDSNDVHYDNKNLDHREIQGSLEKDARRQGRRV